MLNIENTKREYVEAFIKMQDEKKDFQQIALYDLTSFQNENRIYFHFHYVGRQLNSHLFPEGELNYRKPFIYSGKELKAFFEIVEGHDDVYGDCDILKCKLVSLANNDILEFHGAFIQSGGIKSNCDMLLQRQCFSLGRLRKFFGSNFPSGLE